MAKIGLKYPVAAPITSESYGETPVYGEGFVIGKAVSAEKSIETNDNPLYGDDGVAENDVTFASGTITLGVTDFGRTRAENLEIQAKLLGHQIVDDNGVGVLRKGRNDEAPYLGLGYMKTKKHNNEIYYEATWLYKTQFSEFSESANTKAKNIEWQTPSIKGNIMLVEGFEKDTWEDTAVFSTEAQARTWLMAKANIPSNVSRTVLSDAVSAAESKEAETYTSASYADMYVALLNAKAVNENPYAGQSDVNTAVNALNAAIAALAER